MTDEQWKRFYKYLYTQSEDFMITVINVYNHMQRIKIEYRDQDADNQ